MRFFCCFLFILLSLCICSLLPASIETGLSLKRIHFIIIVCFRERDVLGNPNIFPIIKQSFDNFQYSKTMSHILQRKKLVKSMSQAPNLGRLLCRAKFESQRKNHEVKNYGTNCVTYLYLLKASLYQYKRGKKTFLLKNSFNCESSNLSYLPRTQRRICRKNGLSSERVNKYLQAPYKTAAIATNGS